MIQAATDPENTSRPSSRYTDHRRRHKISGVTVSVELDRDSDDVPLNLSPLATLPTTDLYSATRPPEIMTAVLMRSRWRCMYEDMGVIRA